MCDRCRLILDNNLKVTGKLNVDIVQLYGWGETYEQIVVNENIKVSQRTVGDHVRRHKANTCDC